MPGGRHGASTTHAWGSSRHGSNGLRYAEPIEPPWGVAMGRRADMGRQARDRTHA